MWPINISKHQWWSFVDIYTNVLYSKIFRIKIDQQQKKTVYDFHAVCIVLVVMLMELYWRFYLSHHISPILQNIFFLSGQQIFHYGTYQWSCIVFNIFLSQWFKVYVISIQYKFNLSWSHSMPTLLLKSRPIRVDITGIIINVIVSKLC